MIIETHAPEHNVKHNADLIYTLSETIWRQLDEQEDESRGSSHLLKYRTMSRAVYLTAEMVHERTADIKDLDKDEVRDAVMLFYVAAQNAWSYIEKEWGRFPGSMAHARALKSVAEDSLSMVESWYDGPGPTRLNTTMADLNGKAET